MRNFSNWMAKTTVKLKFWSFYYYINNKFLIRRKRQDKNFFSNGEEIFFYSSVNRLCESGWDLKKNATILNKNHIIVIAFFKTQRAKRFKILLLLLICEISFLALKERFFYIFRTWLRRLYSSFSFFPWNLTRKWSFHQRHQLSGDTNKQNFHNSQ